MSVKGIGHVAPDFDGRARFNTLRVRPQYRITLRLGDVEELFPKKPDSKEGRMERLQVLGLFYFPLKHKKASARFADAWDWVKTKILKVASDEDADKAIEAALKCRIVSGAAPPAWADAPSALPPDAEKFDDPKPENFAKIRIPGGYAFQSSDTGRNDNKDAKIPAQFTVNTLHDFETFFYDQNPVLGRIPLIAKVEKRPTPGDDWAPAKDAVVYFQLVPAYAADKPAYDAAKAVTDQVARPPLRSTLGDVPDSGADIGPKKSVEDYEKKHENADDPQGRNCHKDYGGKRGEADVAGTLFDTKSRPGFNAKHSDKARKMSHKDYPLAEKAAPDGKKHKHAVKAKTNEDGEAGVLFMPSRMGGDRYRLRAYVGPPTLTSDGSDPAAAAATTGTFVVWRNLRISRYIRQNVTSTPDSRLVEQAFGGPVGADEREDYCRSLSMVGKASPGDADVSILPLDKADLSDPAPAMNPYESVPRQFAAAYCELELDQGRDPEDLSDDDWKEARKLAAKDMEKGAKSGGPSVNWKTLMCLDTAFDSLKADEAGVQLPMRSPATYNDAVGRGLFAKRLRINSGTLDNGQQGRISTLLWDYGLPGFLRYLCKDGALPGLTVIQGGLGNSWQILGLDDGNSGIGLAYRGCFVWYGPMFYGPRDATFYNFTGNWCHEVGHVLFRQHAPGRPGAPVAGGNKTGRHDALSDCLCVMNYDNGTGQYCGKCLMMLRGWKL